MRKLSFINELLIKTQLNIHLHLFYQYYNSWIQVDQDFIFKILIIVDVVNSDPNQKNSKKLNFLSQLNLTTNFKIHIIYHTN